MAEGVLGGTPPIKRLDGSTTQRESKWRQQCTEHFRNVFERVWAVVHEMRTATSDQLLATTARFTRPSTAGRKPTRPWYECAVVRLTGSARQAKRHSSGDMSSSHAQWPPGVVSTLQSVFREVRQEISSAPSSHTSPSPLIMRARVVCLLWRDQNCAPFWRGSMPPNDTCDETWMWCNADVLLLDKPASKPRTEGAMKQVLNMTTRDCTAKTLTADGHKKRTW